MRAAAALAAIAALGCEQAPDSCAKVCMGGAVTIRSRCSVSDDVVTAAVIVPVRYTYADRPAETEEILFDLHCTKGRGCVAARLELQPLKNGSQLSEFSFYAFSMPAGSVSGRVATVAQNAVKFTIDAERGLVTYEESKPVDRVGEHAYGVAGCVPQ